MHLEEGNKENSLARNNVIHTRSALYRHCFPYIMHSQFWEHFHILHFQTNGLFQLLDTNPYAVNHTDELTTVLLHTETIVLHNCAPPDDGTVRAETCSRWHIVTLL